MLDEEAITNLLKYSLEYGYDEIARILQMEKQALLRKVQELGIEIPEQQLLLKVPEPEKPVKKSKSKKKTKKKRG